MRDFLRIVTICAAIAIGALVAVAAIGPLFTYGVTYQ